MSGGIISNFSMFKTKTGNNLSRLGHLEFGICLEFGAWDLGFSQEMYQVETSL
jgi:hypothetical protein